MTTAHVWPDEFTDDESEESADDDGAEPCEDWEALTDDDADADEPCDDWEELTMLDCDEFVELKLFELLELNEEIELER